MTQKTITSGFDVYWTTIKDMLNNNFDELYDRGDVKYTSGYASIHAAITSIGVEETILVIDTDVTMTQDDTIPSTLTLDFVRGKTINGAWTLAMSQAPLAGNWVLFGSSVTVTISSTQDRRLMWFYSSAQAVGAMVTGSSLIVDGTFDIATYGVIDSTVAFNIVGNFTADSTGDNGNGSVLMNEGGDTIDSPVINIHPAARHDHIEISGLYIHHEGATSYAVVVDNCIYSNVNNNYILCDNAGYGGINYTNDAYFSRGDQNTIRGFVGKGIFIDGNGSEYVIRNNNISSTNPGTVGIETQAPGTKVFDSEIGINNATSGKGIYFNNVAGSVTYGGVVERAFFENFQATSYCIYIDGTTDYFADIIINTIRLSMSDNAGVGVYFGAALSCEIHNPIVVSPRGGGTFVEWSADSVECNVFTQNYNGARAPITVDGSATRASVKVVANLSETGLGLIETDSNLFIQVDYVSDWLSPAIWDGTIWQRVGYHVAKTIVTTATYALLTSDTFLHVTRTTAGTCVITWPTAQMTDGRSVEIKDAGLNSSVNTLSVVTEGAETIEGAVDLEITSDGDCYTIYCDGSDLFFK